MPVRRMRCTPEPRTRTSIVSPSATNVTRPYENRQGGEPASGVHGPLAGAAAAPAASAADPLTGTAPPAAAVPAPVAAGPPSGAAPAAPLAAAAMAAATPAPASRPSATRGTAAAR